MNLRDLITPERILVNPPDREKKPLLATLAALLFDGTDTIIDTYSVEAKRLGKDDTLPGALFFFCRTSGDTPLKLALALFHDPLRLPGEEQTHSLVFLFSQPVQVPGYPLDILSQLSRLLLRRELVERLLAAPTPQACCTVLQDDLVLMEREGGERRQEDERGPDDRRAQDRRQY
jgi:hypothetical protein